MNLIPINAFLEANTDLSRGYDLFVYEGPAELDRYVLTLLDPSRSQVDHEIKGRYLQRFQIIVRDPDYASAEARAYEIFRLVPHETLRDYDGEYCAHYTRPVGRPIPYRRSDADVVEFSLNFDCLFTETA